MTKKSRTGNAELDIRVAAFTESSGLSPTSLLQTIETWRRLQSGASAKKSPLYSQEINSAEGVMDDIKTTAETFVESSRLSHTALRRVLEAWRRLQSGASDKKTPAYSNIED
jgi:RNase adaptor protein for sRNA GlmZ degradation